MKLANSVSVSECVCVCVSLSLWYATMGNVHSVVKTLRCISYVKNVHKMRRVEGRKDLQ